MRVLLAQEPDEAPTIEMVEPARPLTEFLDDWLGDGPLVSLLVGAIDIVAQVALIVIITLIVVTMLRRLIRRAVARASTPQSSEVGKGLRLKVGLGDGSSGGYSLRRAQRAEALGALAVSSVRVTMWVLALFLILSNAFGINLAPLVAGAGILGVAVGFGAQGLVRDFITGVFMLAEDQYGVGDIIDVGEASGVVEGVTLRTTRIRDVTGTLWHVPNGVISRVGNMSQEWARALLDIAVPYGTDVDVVSELILRVASDMADEPEYDELFLDEPEIWGVEALGDNSVDVRLVIKTQPGQQWAISRELRRRIKNAFDAADVEIPFPQRTVWLRTEQPISLGDSEAPDFKAPVPDSSALDRALEAAKRGDTSPPPGDLDEVLSDEALPDGVLPDGVIPDDDD